MEDKQQTGPTLPKLQWKKATCEICGAIFEYSSKRRPHTCKKGECLYRYHYDIDPHTWANYQPGLFDPVKEK